MLRLSDDRDPVETLATDFLERQRRGESPTIDEYVDEYPHLADEIRDLFPTIAAMEDWKALEESNSDRPVSPETFGLEKFGDFRILREIGRGGMGIVYEAEQESLGRRVAVKVLPRQSLTSEQQVEQFQREARTAANLHHTNIVPVFGVGQQKGYHYYVMQIIHGVALDQFITASYAAGDRIDWQRIARFGIQAAGAMHYAHRQGVLHRDIKPANLLLASDESGEHEHVWITDFGLALAMESDAERSETVATAGTLRYMPVEQLDGKPTAQSDIYSLGLTLHELLTGRPAYQESSPSQLLQRIRQGDITPLRGIDRNLPRDLEAILLKATAKDVSQRYRAAKDLADDLERLLANRPVLARRTTPVGHAIRWMQRNPLATVLSCIATVLLVGVITATALGYLSARAGERRESALRKAEQEQRLREVEQRQRAEAALQVAMESLDELFTQIESNRRPGQRLDPTEARAMLDALQRMLVFYEQLAEQGQGGPESQIRVAEALRRMGDLHRSLHDYEAAESTLLEAIASLEGLIEDMPDETEPHIQHARANYTLGRVYRDMGRRDEGDSLIQFAITELEALPSDAPQRRHIQELLSRFRRDVRRVPGE